MSDLACFVAATIRDKVVADLQQELEQMKAKLRHEQNQAKLVSITGPMGQPVYTQTLFDSGHYDHNPKLWRVEFPTRVTHDIAANGHQNVVSATPPSVASQQASCTLRDLADIEIRIGGICKARFGSGGTVEAFVNDIDNHYDEENRSGTVSIWFGGCSGIWLSIELHNIERQRYASLRDYDLEGENLLPALQQFWRSDTEVTFDEVSFLISSINGAMERFGIPVEPPNEGT